MSRPRQRPSKRSESSIAYWLTQAKHRLIGMARLFMPRARGVYHPQPHSAVILGVLLPHDADLDAIEAQLWWRGLGVVRRGRDLIAGADVTTAAQHRRLKHARKFVTQQLRDAGVRGPVKRWE